MRTSRFITIAALALALTACAGTNFKWDDARQIKAGMTEQEVTALMGPPYLVKSEGGRLIWVWSHGNALGGSRSISVVFVDGKVIAPPPIPDSFN